MGQDYSKLPTGDLEEWKKQWRQRKRNRKLEKAREKAYKEERMSPSAADFDPGVSSFDLSSFTIL